MKVHELKTDPDVYQASISDKKHWEIRFDDRGYEVGDVLRLRETQFTGEEMKAGKPLIFTGRQHEVCVNFILRGPVYGLKDGWVIMSVS